MATPIKIYTLGRFALVRNGTPLAFPAKTRKPIELLKALLAAGGREVGSSQLSDLLWPEAEGDAAHNVLGVTLHRLRILFGERDAILLRDNKLALNPSCCWVDAWELERQLGKLDVLLKSAQPCQLAVNATTAELLGLYTGAFLKGEQGSVVAAARERLHDKLLQVLGAIGHFWEQHGDWAHAQQYYRKGLELNPVRELLYQRLMVCHRELGQRAEAMVVYRRCHANLSEHLNISPSKQTETILLSLIDD